ncbi:response regulator [Mycolicibacterium sp.]|uniref:response regulator n=1 Tax=Mycolicibacterium sp. TaxID=2320850 RepID=UPI0037C5DC85
MTAEQSGGWDPLYGAQLLVVDDYVLFREHLVGTLGKRGAEARVAYDVPSLVAALRGSMVDIVLLNMGAKDSEALLDAVVQVSPTTKVIAIGLSEDDEARIVACAEAGVSGYHLRAESLADLLRIVELVADGGTSCSPQIATILMRRLSALSGRRAPASRGLGRV